MVDFKKKLKEIAAQTAPSMIPGPAEETPAPPEKPEELPNVATLIPNQKMRLEFEKLVDRHGEIGQELAPLNKERKTLTDKIKKLAGTYGVGKAVAGAWRINYFNSPRSSVDQTKLTQALLELGVSMATIKKAVDRATTVKDSYTLKVTALGDEGEEENAA